MKKRYSLSQTELDEFRKAVGHIKKLKKTEVLHPQKRLVRKRIIPPSPPNPPILEPTPPVTSEEFVSFSRSHLQKKILSKLRQGKYPIQAQLDLHGLTTEKAGIALQHFFTEIQTRGLRHVLIIHGKGAKKDHVEPILKNYTVQYLRGDPHVLAFTSSIPQHGGRGAVYVLLKSPRKQLG